MFLLQMLNELKSRGIVLWNKGGGQLGFSYPKEKGFPDALKEWVKAHKGELLALLTLNAIDSEQRAKSCPYLKLPGDQHARTLQSIQKGMYLPSRIDPLPYTYTIPLFIRIHQPDLKRLDAAILALLARNPILRMCAAEDLSFTVLAPEQLPIQHSRVEAHELGSACETRAKVGFQPGAPLILPEVLEVAGTPDVVVSLCHHHMLSDAYSADLLIHQLMGLYEACADGVALAEPDDASRALNYFDHVAYQQVECASPGYREAQKVLVGKLEQAEKLQLKRKTLTSQDNHASTLTFTVDAAACHQLRALANEHHLGLYSILFTALYQTLAAFSNGEPGFPIGLTVANRPDEFRHAIGPFINTLPLIPEYRPGDSFLMNAVRVQREILFLNQHNQLNLNMLAEQLRNSGDLPELVQVLFTLHNFKPAEPLQASVAYEVIPHPDLAEKFGITLVAKEHSDHLSFTVTYANTSFEEAFIRTLFDSYLTLLANLTPQSLYEPANRLSLLGPAERQRLLVDWNRTEAPFEHERTIAQLFERQVEKTPDNLAVVYQDKRLTYRQLNARANQLAHWLRAECGLAPQTMVCLCLDRSEDMLIVVLGILKAGCAYVPIDPSFPTERMDFILEDTQTPLLITNERYLSAWRRRKPRAALFAIDSASSRAALAQQPSDNPSSPIGSDALAYVIYTSGTTGKPKGVMCEHSGTVNRIQWMNKQYPLRESDKILQKTTYVFDVSVWELLWANWYGACIVFAEPEGHKDAHYLIDLIEREQITVTHFVPSMFSVFQDSLRALPSDPSRPRLASLRYIFCSGEALKLKHVQDCHALLPLAQPHNLYGPTEASIDVLYFDCTDRSLDAVPIGKPIDNTQVYVLNEALQPLPVYAIGELHLGGVGLARGYLNRAELTAQRFIANPFASTSGQARTSSRLYRTGDLVRWLPDGNIEYLGRNDFQVKIRGQRIELGEIEAALAQCPGVKQSLALVRAPTSEPGAPQFLVGYYVSELPLDEAALLRQLNEKLPQYMVPNALVHLTQVPVTINGKLDRKALPDPQWPDREQYVPPRDEREERLRALWAESLGIEAHKLGIRDDLFNLGMDSIIAIQLVSRLRQQLALKVSVKDVFAHKTIERFYDHLITLEAEQARASRIVAEQGRLSGELGLLPIQSWFFTRNFAQPTHWNQAFLVKTPALDLGRLEVALQALVQRHDAFRLRYRAVPGHTAPRQYYVPSAPFARPRRLDVRILSADEGTAAFHEELHDRLTAWQSGFDLQYGPLYYFGYLHGYADGSSRLFFALHHLIVDTVSWHILLEDLRALYEQRPLGDKGSSYRQWVDAVVRHGQAHATERAFWQQLLADYQPEQQPWLRAAEPGSPEESQFSLDKAQTDALLRGAHRAYHTQVNDLLLTAIGFALQEMDGNPTHHLMVEGHGREEIDPTLDITRTLGWFTTLYPVRLSVEGGMGEGLKRIKESLRAIPEKGLGFGSLMGYGEQALPPICFNYLGQLDRDSTSQDEWRIVAEDSGDAMPAVNQTGVLLNLFAFVVEGQLHLRIDSRLETPRTEAFRKALERQLAALLAHCLEKEVGEYTPSDFHAVTSEADLGELPLLPNPDRSGWFAMTELQKAYLIGRLGHYEIGNVANHIYNEYLYRQLDVERLEASLNRLIAECDVLRTVYSFERLQQRYLPLEDVPRYAVRVNHFEDRPYDPALLEPVRARMSHHVYDAERFPLFSFEVSRFQDRCVLHVSMDLIILDVQSRLALFSLLDDLYRGADIQPKLPRVSFKDYQDHAGLLRHSRWYQNDKAYWQAKLPSLALRPKLAFKQAPESIEQPRFSEHTLYVAPSTWAKFKAQAQRNNVSYSSALLGLYGSLISYFSGASEFLITLTLFNRYAVCDDVDAILGDFTSTNLFHFADAGRDAQALLRRTHDVLWEDISHALYSGLDVQRELSKLHGLDSHQAVSPIIFTGVAGNQTRRFERAAFLEDNELIEQRHWCAQTSQAWIDLQAIEVGDRFMSKWLYVEQLFDSGYIEHLNRVYCALIEHLAEHDWQGDLPFERYLPAQDRAVIEAANQETLALSDDTLFGAYEQRCRAQGRESATAVVDLGVGESYSYGTLLAHSERLAHALYRLGASSPAAEGAEARLIGVLIEKGYHQVLACCSIMKAGYGYLPLHVDWPAGRVDDVLSQAGSSLLLISRAQYERDDVQAQLAGKYRLLVIDELLAQSADAALEGSLPQVDADAVAYVIFTPGSTGKPKGVTITHRAALNTLNAVNQRFAVSATDKVLALSELSFALSVYDLFGLLAAGGQIVFTPQRATKDPAAWLEAIEHHQITLWNTVPQLAGLLVDALQRSGKTCSSMRVFMLSGDWIPTRLPDQLKAVAPKAEVMSLGGATEGSIWSIWYPVETVPADWTSIPYGVAMPNQKMYVLNENLQHCPLGITGEIHIGGMGVALNYWRDEALTHARFIEHPTLGRLYKTGDLGRWSAQGYIEFLGRNDFQVKLRGHRVELGEIENALLRHPDIKQSLVLVKEQSQANSSVQYLVGYYVAERTLDHQALLDQLAASLPEYMVPALLVHLRELPLTTNGKLDRKALPEPAFGNSGQLAAVLPDYMLPNALLHLAQLPLAVNGKLDVKALPLPGAAPTKTFTAPRGEFETLLAELWKEMLGLQQVGIHDRFFELGGNSILLTRLYVRLPADVRERVSLVDLFKYPTIAKLSEHLQGSAPRPEARPAQPQRTAAPVGLQDIAIIGMAGRFPMADDLQEYWDNLLSGREATQHYSREELLEAGVPASILDQPGYIRAQSRLRDFKSFDASFFGYSPREAEIMDPQHRLFLECAWHALEDAHVDPYTYSGEIGLYASAGQNNYLSDYVLPALGNGDLPIQYQTMINNQANYLCTKVAYRLNLTGPAVTVQTACSSSLVAVHQACLALQAGDCDIAMAGGVSIGKLEKEGYTYQDGLIFSPDGKCRAFDSAAHGTLEGQGVGIVVLKPLAQALADGDSIRAVIKGSAINNDGRNKIGYTAPSQERQAKVIRAAQRKAGIRPETLTYVEAHGTGTLLGDPIEFEGLKAAFGDTSSPAPYCALGSVKTNIGHLDVAAGIAGLIKTVLCLEQRTLVPSLHFETPNPRIGFAGSPFYVNTQVRPWTAEGPLRAGVSSFGIGGTNAHVILEEAPQARPSITPARPRAQHLLVLSAHTAEALERQSTQLAKHLQAHPELPLDRVAYTLQVARHRFAHNRVVVGADKEALIQALRTPQPSIPLQEDRGPVVFMFPGQGAQYPGMGRQLYEHEPRFREQVDRCLALLRPHLPSGLSDADILGWNERVHHTQLTQPALFIFEHALAQWFIGLGVKPAAMIGHSLGEYVAACLAGVFSLEDALRLVLERGRLLASLPEGKMLAVPLAAELLRQRAERLGVDIAVINDGNSCVLSGSTEAIEQLAAELAKEGIHGKPLKVSHAFHSRLLEPVLAQYQAQVARLRLQPPQLPFLSNLSGGWANPAEVVTPRYWAEHLRQTVRFHQDLSTLFEDPRMRHATCLELGPNQILTRLAQRHPSRNGGLVLPTQPRAEQAERSCASLLSALGHLWATGHTLDSGAYYGLGSQDRLRLPAYPFAHQEHWMGKASRAEPAISAPPPVPAEVAGDQLIAALKNIWQNLLGLRQAGLDDDFFEQGGDSLTAVQLVAAIQRLLGLKLEFMSLEKHTLRAIAARLQQQVDGQTSSGSPLVVIKRGHPQHEPLVLVHPVGGDVYFYRELAQCLPAEQPVYAIRSPMLDGDAHFTSIEAMAEAYLDLLESEGLRPPYRLGGSSFGGIVAYHMASLVKRRYGSAPELVMIDSPAYGNLPQPMSELEILDYLARYGLAGLRFSLEELSALPSLEEKIRYLASRARGTAFEDMLSAEFLPRLIRTWRHHGELMQRYVPEPYAGPILFFSHQEVIAEFPAHQYAHWRKLALGPCQEIPVPGNHLSMNAMPNVAHIAAALCPQDGRWNARPPTPVVLKETAR